MAITTTEHGATIIDGQTSVMLYRLCALRAALRLEAVGLKMSRGPSALSIVKSELGFKGSRAAVLAQLEAHIEASKAMHDAGEV